MKIVFTGGGSGGHFYPLIAIAEAMNDLVRERRLIEPQLYYLGPEPFDQNALFDNGIAFVRIPAGKVRRYFSLRNVSDLFLSFSGLIAAIAMLYRLYPDVVVSKGGYASVPVILAAKLLRIPIVIHESDSKPGRANLLAAKYATKIAITFDSAAALFPKSAQHKIARTGIPIRKALTRTEPEGARQYLDLEPGIPTVVILTGSLGAVRINEAVVSALPALLAFANVIHQTGEKNIKDIEALTQVILEKEAHKERYHPVGFLSELSLQRAAGVADLIISRAGSGTIAEIGLWKKPAILIPIPEAISHDQRSNAYAYARTGAAIVLEEGNLTPHLLASEAERIVHDKALSEKMRGAAAGFTDPDSAKLLAEAILGIALEHE